MASKTTATQELLLSMLQLRRTMHRGLGAVLRSCPRCQYYWALARLCMALEHHAGPGGAIAMGDLAQAMDESLPSCSRMVRILEREGMATRTADPANRRRTLVRVTPLGIETHRQCEAAVNRYLAGVARRMGADYLNQLQESCHRLQKALDDEADALAAMAAGQGPAKEDATNV